MYQFKAYFYKLDNAQNLTADFILTFEAKMFVDPTRFNFNYA